MNDSPSNSVWSCWETRVRQHPDKSALVEADGSKVSFAALDQRIRSTLDAFPPALRPTLVAAQFPNNADWLVAYLRCAARGEVFLPLDAQMPRSAAMATAERLDASRLERPDGVVTFPENTLPPPGAHLVKLTSGSTGDPQALFFSASAMIADGENIIAGMGLRPSDRHLAIAPLGHSYGLGNLVMPLLLQGCTLVCAHDPWPHALLERIRDAEATVLPLVPPLIKSLAALPEETPLPRSVRLVLSAGGLLLPEIAARFRQRWGQPVHNFYGSSETGGISFDPSGERTNVGLPLPGVSLRIKAEGALEVSSRAVHRATPADSGPASVTVPDRAREESDGSLTLLGRRSDIIKIGGRRVSLLSVQNTIKALPEVTDAHVFTETRRDSGELRLAAIVATALGLPALETALRDALPVAQRPRRLKLCAALPYNQRGKIDREALRKLFGDQDDSDN